MRQRTYKRGDLVKITEDVEKLMETQFAPEKFAKEAAGIITKIERGYNDKSYDLEGTPLKLDDSVFEFIGHPKKGEVRKCTHVYSDVFYGSNVCFLCFCPRHPRVVIGVDVGEKNGD